MRAVDTNVLVRLLTRDDEQQYAKALAFVANGAWVSHIVLCETTWVLSAAYDWSRTQIAATIDMLLAHSSMVLEGGDVVRAALAMYRKAPIDFPDALILETARAAGHTPLGTFDRALGKLPGVQPL